MSFIYVIVGILLLGLAISFLDRREKMKIQIKSIQNTKDEIIELNSQLDGVINELEGINEPLFKVNQTCKEILKYWKK